MKRLFTAAACAAAVMFTPLVAEQASYGEVELLGLGRESWPLNNLPTMLSMVCNLNGPDGFLTIRTGPDTNHASARKLNRLAIIEVAPQLRVGRWVKVVTAYRTVTKNGISQPVKSLPVQGWAHDGYLCDFIH